MKQRVKRTLRSRIHTDQGFTLVELSVVIAVIAILAIIATSSFSAIQAKTNYSVIDKDMRAMNLAIKKYYAKNGSYPSTSDAWQFRRQTPGGAFIPGLSPNFYVGTLPDVTSGDQSNPTNNTYMYKSNGIKYKLVRINTPTLPGVEVSTVPAALKDPSGVSNTRWGYWSTGDDTYN